MTKIPTNTKIYVEVFLKIRNLYCSPTKNKKKFRSLPGSVNFFFQSMMEERGIPYFFNNLPLHSREINTFYFAFYQTNIVTYFKYIIINFNSDQFTQKELLS